MIDIDATNRQAVANGRLASLRQELEQSEYERRCLGEAAKVAGKLLRRLREPCADRQNCCERCARVEELGR